MIYLLLGLLGAGLAASLVFDSDDDTPPPDNPDTPEPPDPAINGTQILGTDADDTLTAEDNDTLRGGSGNDDLTGSGNAVLSGGRHGDQGDDALTLHDTATAAMAAKAMTASLPRTHHRHLAMRATTDS